MDADQRAAGTVRGHRSALEDASRWSSAVAVLLGLAGAADLVRWGNRWYISEVFARDAGGPGGVSWESVYRLLHDAHAALVRGLVLLLLATVVALITRRIRRRPAG